MVENIKKYEYKDLLLFVFRVYNFGMYMLFVDYEK